MTYSTAHCFLTHNYSFKVPSAWTFGLQARQRSSSKVQLCIGSTQKLQDQRHCGKSTVNSTPVRQEQGKWACWSWVCLTSAATHQQPPRAPAWCADQAVLLEEEFLNGTAAVASQAPHQLAKNGHQELVERHHARAHQPSHLQHKRTSSKNYKQFTAKNQ